MNEVNFRTLFPDNIKSSVDPNKLYDEFISLVLDIYESCFPVKKMRIKQNKNMWFDEILQKMHKKKNKLYRKYLENPTEYRKTAYKKFKNKYINALRTTKKKYYAQMFMNVKGNSNGTWKIINNLINNRKSNVNEKQISIHPKLKKKQ